MGILGHDLQINSRNMSVYIYIPILRPHQEITDVQVLRYRLLIMTLLCEIYIERFFECLFVNRWKRSMSHIAPSSTSIKLKKMHYERELTVKEN